MSYLVVWNIIDAPLLPHHFHAVGDRMVCAMAFHKSVSGLGGRFGKDKLTSQLTDVRIFLARRGKDFVPLVTFSSLGRVSTAISS